MDFYHDAEAPAVPAAAGPAREEPEDSAAPARNHAKDVHILSAAFFFVFSAAGAAQNLESSVNAKQDLGVTSMGVLYASFTLFSLVAAPLVAALGSKRSLLAGSAGFWLFMAANLKPTWYTMMPAAVCNGFCSAILWVGQGTYLTSAARSHAKDYNSHEGTIIGNFNGEFWGVLAGSQVAGNMVPLALLKIRKGGESSTSTTLLFSVFLVSVTVGITLICFLSNRDEKDKDPCSARPAGCCSSIRQSLQKIITPFSDKRMLLIIPVLAYLALQRAFTWAEFTKSVVKPAIGVSGVGTAMAVYGGVDAACSLLGGRLTSGVSSITVIVGGGVFIQILVYSWILMKHSSTGGVLRTAYPWTMAALMGAGDGTLSTELSVLVGLLFKDDTEGAFAQTRVWQGASTAAVFFLSPRVTLRDMSAAMIAAVCTSMLGFLYLGFRVERASVPET